MAEDRKKIFEKIKEYHFEFKHVTVLFLILFIFQLVISFINKASIKDFLTTTQEWYQKESAEEIANLTATSLELVIESISKSDRQDAEQRNKIIQSFEIIFSQQQLSHNINNLSLLVRKKDKIIKIEDGKSLYNLLIEKDFNATELDSKEDEITKLYSSVEDSLKRTEQITSIITDRKTFHTFVPFVIKGEYLGAVYLRNTPDFSSISNRVISNYDETSVIYLSLILLGLLAMYFISSYTVKERDAAQKMLFEEHEENLKKQINYEKELIFTKRIYHTHHKAEKIMGFIKEDLRTLSDKNIDEIKFRVSKYSNFISRVIYDMKWFDPPVQTIRNSMFRTDLNEVIRFIIDNIFLRISSQSTAFKINFEPDNNLPIVNVNEFVIWEIIEPLIQNSIDHGGESNLVITVRTKYYPSENKSFIFIEDNGKGIAKELLEKNEDNLKLIFVENTTTKTQGLQNSGYGCYIAYEMTKRCGWNIDAENINEGGCRFTITINN
ncbi:MAG: ATP-binding protein [Ignavibacterium album]|uniref:sensor histidine kinase n=1 Tax=Ignavibacterium album TaxID=591197 RepID=UPI0026EAF1BD|nr:ATP-binding protein [Ignavibacterium album]MCX8104983.1 ATP-binding protein [Ignavibacterium album]